MPEITPLPTSLVISYLTIRRSIGILGILFSAILFLYSVLVGNCNEVQVSISAYYHTICRDVFVAIISITGFFLMSYRGYDHKDRFACKLAAFFAFGIALFPTKISLATNCTIIPLVPNPLAGTLHLLFAGAFFTVVAYISFFLFTKSNKEVLGKDKRKRNAIYKFCGIIIILCLALITAHLEYFVKVLPEIQLFKPVFWLETVALLAFGLSWLTKGEILFRDSQVEASSISNDL